MTLRAEPLDQEEITSIEEILIFNIPEFEVLIELLQEKGIISSGGLMARMKKLDRETKER